MHIHQGGNNMGRGGHHRSFHRSHYRRYGSSYNDTPLWVYLVILGVVLTIGFFITTANNDKIRSGDKINVECELVDYMQDNAGYFSEEDEAKIIESLKYFYQKTGAQMVIVTQKENINDSGTEKLYYEMFDDEAHVLIVLPMDGLFGTNYTQYYYMGDEALKVIDETGMNRMLDKIDNSLSSKGTSWSNQIKNIADLIME